MIHFKRLYVTMKYCPKNQKLSTSNITQNWFGKSRQSAEIDIGKIYTVSYFCCQAGQSRIRWALEHGPPEMECDIMQTLLFSVIFTCLGVILEAVISIDPCKIKFSGPLIYLPDSTHLIAVGIQPISNRCITELCFSSTIDTIPKRLKTDQWHSRHLLMILHETQR